jgi:putative peptidoglycan lipid II flippase
LLIKWRDVIETVKLSVPRTFALSISSFVSFFFTILAGSISVGAIAIFNLSSNLQSAPIALIGASFSLAAFPALAASFAKNDLLDLVKKISEGLRQIVFWSLPFTVFMIVLRAHIVRVILGSGVFDWSATRLVAGSLALFIISLVFQNILIFLSRSHYALGKTLWPLLANLISGLTAVLLALVMLDKFEFFNYFLAMIASFLKIADLSYRVVILPLALSVGSTVGAILLFFALGENIRSSVWREIKWPIFRSVLASLVGGIVSYQALRALDGLFSLQKFWGVLGHGFFAGLAGIVFWLFMLFILKDQDFQRLFSFMKSKLTKI